MRTMRKDGRLERACVFVQGMTPCERIARWTVVGGGYFGSFVGGHPSHCEEHGRATVERMNARDGGGGYRLVRAAVQEEAS